MGVNIDSDDGALSVAVPIAVLRTFATLLRCFQRNQLSLTSVRGNTGGDGISEPSIQVVQIIATAVPLGRENEARAVSKMAHWRRGWG
jgi:hypothetical protein